MNKCPLCPFYEVTSSYGTELIECSNVYCPFCRTENSGKPKKNNGREKANGIEDTN